MPTFVQLANTYSKYFTASKRDSGEVHIHLKEGAPEALTDLVRAALVARGSLMMPDDYRYEMVWEALDTIAELDADADENVARDRFAEVEPPIYTTELTAWLASRADRYVYCDEAAEEYGGDMAGDIMLRLLALGWLAEFREVAESVLTTLMEQAKAMDVEGDAS